MEANNSKKYILIDIKYMYNITLKATKDTILNLIKILPEEKSFTQIYLLHFSASYFSNFILLLFSKIIYFNKVVECHNHHFF